MRKRRYVLAIGGLLLLSATLWRWLGDQVIARVSGSPVRLLSSSDPFELESTSDAQSETLTHVFLRDDNLRVVVRAWFYNDGAIAQPYLSVDGQKRGVLHLGAKSAIPLLFTRCEFLRQLEVEIRSDQCGR